MLLLRLLLTLLAGLLILLAALAYLMARFLLRPPRMTDGKAAFLLKRLTPLDLGLSFTPLTFTVQDKLTQKPLNLAGWWIPHNDTTRTAILLHGYADAKVGVIAWAPLFHELQYNILALDLRAHGESGGEISTAGFCERDDLNQVLNDVRARYPHQTQHLILFGASLGAAVAIALAADRTDIDAVILESPFADFQHAAAAHFHLLGIQFPLLHRIAITAAQKISHADFAAIRPLDLIEKSHAPLLIIQGQDDILTSSEDQQQLQRAVKNRPDNSQFWHPQNVPHLMSLAIDPTAYKQRIADFLSRSETSNFKSNDANPLTSPSSHPTL